MNVIHGDSYLSIEERTQQLRERFSEELGSLVEEGRGWRKRKLFWGATAAVGAIATTWFGVDLVGSLMDHADKVEHYDMAEAHLFQVTEILRRLPESVSTLPYSLEGAVDFAREQIALGSQVIYPTEANAVIESIDQDRISLAQGVPVETAREYLGNLQGQAFGLQHPWQEFVRFLEGFATAIVGYAAAGYATALSWDYKQDEGRTLEKARHLRTLNENTLPEVLEGIQSHPFSAQIMDYAEARAERVSKYSPASNLIITLDFLNDQRSPHQEEIFDDVASAPDKFDAYIKVEERFKRNRLRPAI